MARVILLEPCKLNVTQASKWGVLEHIFKQGERRSSIWSESFKNEVIERLQCINFDPEEDSLIIAGHMVPLIIAVALLVTTYGGVRVLFYSAVDRDYVPRTLGENHEAGSSIAV